MIDIADPRGIAEDDVVGDEAEVAQHEAQIAQRESELRRREAELNQWDSELRRHEAELEHQEAQLAERESELEELLLRDKLEDLVLLDGTGEQHKMTAARWQRFNRHSWRHDYRGFVEWFFATLLPEPHSTKVLEDCLSWAMETGPDALIAGVIPVMWNHPAPASASSHWMSPGFAIAIALFARSYTTFDGRWFAPPSR